MNSSLSINIDQRNLYTDMVELLNNSPVNIEAKRLIVSLISKQINDEANRVIASELQGLKEASDESVMD